MANETMRTSAAGLSALSEHEGAVLHYYNDSADNCTYGVGTLAHVSPCTAEELRRPVTQAQVNTQLNLRVSVAEAAVRRGVPDRELTQAQFDSLVSFVYNTGAGGAAATLRVANRGDDRGVVGHMTDNVYVHPHVNGRRGPAVRLRGLVNRRQAESAPFR